MSPQVGAELIPEVVELANLNMHFAHAPYLLETLWRQVPTLHPRISPLPFLSPRLSLSLSPSPFVFSAFHPPCSNEEICPRVWPFLSLFPPLSSGGCSSGRVRPGRCGRTGDRNATRHGNKSHLWSQTHRSSCKKRSSFRKKTHDPKSIHGHSHQPIAGEQKTNLNPLFYSSRRPPTTAWSRSSFLVSPAVTKSISRDVPGGHPYSSCLGIITLLHHAASSRCFSTVFSRLLYDFRVSLFFFSLRSCLFPIPVFDPTVPPRLIREHSCAVGLSLTG